MFRLRRNQTGLLNSQLFDEHSFYKAMSADIKTARQSILIESPFITVRRSKEISILFRKVIKKDIDIVIHTRNPNYHDINKIQAIQGIELLKASGAKVLVFDDMRHRKLAIIDDRILWEGSLNMLSHSNSREIMRRSVSEDMCKEMLQCLI